MSLARFIEKWTSGYYPPDPVTELDLQRAEERFGVRLPEGYRQAVLEYGLPRPTADLLHAIVERDLDIHSVGDFFSPSEIIEQTLAWREIGMPEQLIAFASDGCGNKFCFDADRLRSGAVDSCAIWFFDHDFGRVNAIEDSFTAWITALCDVEPWTEAEP